MMKNVFYYILKVFLVLKYLIFCPGIIGYEQKAGSETITIHV